MKEQNKQELLEVKSIGSLNRLAIAKTKKEEITVDKITSKKPNLKRDFQRIINWAHNNVVPFFALVVLSGLAGQRAIQFIPEMNETARTVAGIVFVSILVVEVLAGKLKLEDK